jgi:head-tail adaptor
MVSEHRAAIYRDKMTVQSPTLTRDSSGGIVETWPPAGGFPEFEDLACHVHQLRPQQMLDFAQAGYQATHEVCTEQGGILAGWRLVLEDETVLRVTMVQHVRSKQGVPEYFRVLADEVRLA